MTKRKNKVIVPPGVEQMPVGLLKPYERNPRTHTRGQIEAIAAAIREFGFTVPILVDETGRLVAGHGRLEAAKKLGMEKVPVIVLDHLTEEQRRAYVIADNQLAAQAGWDEDLLAAELEQLQESDFDLSLLGFSDEELEDLLAGDDELADQPVQAPPSTRPATTEPGTPADPGVGPGPVDELPLRYSIEVPDTDLRPRIVDLLNEIEQLGAVVVRG